MGGTEAEAIDEARPRPAGPLVIIPLILAFVSSALLVLLRSLVRR